MPAKKQNIYNFEDFEIFPWTDNLNTNEEEIDQQHRSLVDLLNRLARVLVNNQEIEINKAFSELADYADYHFKTEEEYWVRYMGDDPWVESHKEIHNSFLPQVVEMKNKYSTENSDDAIEEIVNFLIRWLAFHIIDSDKRMSLTVSEIRKGKNAEESKALSSDEMSGSMKVLTDTILMMYDGLSSNAIKLMKERRIRMQAEDALKKANSDLAELSITDTLTGLFNRRHFNILGQQEFKRAIREQISVGFIEMDIDKFKLVNDTKGHQEGDRILERLGIIIKESCRRPEDFAFRLGGEEFAVLLVLQDAEGTRFLAEKIRQRFQMEEGITISCGVHTLIPQRGDRLEDLVSTADKMLYKAKKSGRNKTVVFGE